MDGPERLPDDERVRVLVAEDNQVNQKVIVRILQQAGYECQLANNGKQAVEMLMVGGRTLTHLSDTTSVCQWWLQFVIVTEVSSLCLSHQNLRKRGIL